MQSSLGDRAAHHAIAWYLKRLAKGIGRDEISALAVEIRELFAPGVEAHVVAGFMADRVRHLGNGVRVLEVEDRSDSFSIATVETGSGQRWRVFATADPTTGRIRQVGSAQAAPRDVVIRDAVPGDGGAIAELVRQVPIEAGGASLLIDYGDDYLDATDTGDSRVVVVAERDCRLVGLHGCVRFDLLVDDVPQPHRYIRHTRVDPSARGGGVFSALNGLLFERTVDDWLPPCSLIAVRNDAMLGLFPAALRRWGTPWERFHLDTAALAQRGRGSRSTAVIDDLDHVVSLLRHAQGDATARVPLSSERLAARLGRSPEQYSGECLRGNASAAVGVARSRVRVRREGDRTTTEAVAWDVGMEPDAAAALLDVLRDWCAELAAEGVDRLVVGCGRTSPVRDAVAPIATEHEVFLVQAAWPVPEDRTPSFAFDAAPM